MLPAFSSGEISPRLYARVDLSKYHTGAALLENFFVDYRGGVSNRPGTKYIGTCPSILRVRLIPFVQSITTTYILEFGNLYMRVIKNGAYVLTGSVNIAAITQANPGVITTSTPHGLTTGDQVYLQNIVGMTQLNNRFFIAIVTSPTAFTLRYVHAPSTDVSTAAYSAYTSGGTVGKLYLITTPYTDTEVADLRFAQSVSIMTLTHPSHPAARLTRTADDNWTLTTITFGPSLAAPTGVAATQTPVTTTPNTAYYIITALDSTGDESRPSDPGSTGINPADSSAVVQWTGVPGAVAYNVYKLLAPFGAPIPTLALFGFIGQVGTNTFNDIGFSPNAGLTAPQAKNPIGTANNYPVTVTYFQQRQVFGGSNNDPQTLWMSKVGAYINMDVSLVVRDDDAITATLVSTQLNNIRHMISMPGGLIVLTGYGAWQVSGGGQNTSITPSNFIATPQAYQGASNVPPLIINYDVIYNSALGNTVRDLTYSFVTNIYSGTDISAISSHLFDGFTLSEWAYADSPFKMVWAIRSDGMLLSMAFMKEQEVIGWSHHLTDQEAATPGKFESVASVIEGSEEAVYFVVSHQVNGIVFKMVERLASRQLSSNISNSWFLDSGLQYNGAATNVLRGMDHMAGKTVSVLSGLTVYEGLVVSSDGVVTLPGGATVTSALAGLPFEASFQTLRIDLGEPTQQGKRKMISSVTMRMFETNGLEVGPDADSLQPWDPTVLNFSGDIDNSLYTGDLYLNIGGGWDPAGQFYARQDQPFPVTILGAIPEIVLGDTVK